MTQPQFEDGSPHRAPRPIVPPRWLISEGVPELPADTDTLCLVFPYAEVATLRVGRAADGLMHLIEDDTRRQRLVHGLSFAFEGWNHDPRPIHHIPECRRYMQALHGQWPYWLHFLIPDPSMWATLLLSLLPTPALPLPVDEGSVDARGVPYRVEEAELRPLLMAMLPPMQLLHGHMRLSEQQCSDILWPSLKAIRQAVAT